MLNRGFIDLMMNPTSRVSSKQQSHRSMWGCLEGPTARPSPMSKRANDTTLPRSQSQLICFKVGFYFWVFWCLTFLFFWLLGVFLGFIMFLASKGSLGAIWSLFVGFWGESQTEVLQDLQDTRESVCPVLFFLRGQGSTESLWDGRVLPGCHGKCLQTKNDRGRGCFRMWNDGRKMSNTLCQYGFRYGFRCFILLAKWQIHTSLVPTAGRANWGVPPASEKQPAATRCENLDLECILEMVFGLEL